MVKPLPTKASRAHAATLRARAGVERVILMTDAARGLEPKLAVRALPPDSIVILRDYQHPGRYALAASLASACRAHGCWFLVAGDASLARAVGADGVHLPEFMLASPPRTLAAFGLVSAACHNRLALKRALAFGVDLAIVSPVFQTDSHPGSPALGVHRLSRLVEGAGLPVAALGGVSSKTAARLRGLRLAGVAGISGIVSD